MEYTVSVIRHKADHSEPIYLRRFDDSNAPAVRVDVEYLFGDIEGEAASRASREEMREKASADYNASEHQSYYP